MKNILEICAGDIASVEAAALGGADRVELCSALAVGGVTPSEGFIRAARQVESLKLHVLVRPREGDFCYSRREVGAMLRDIAVAAECGADGVVVGALRPDGTLDSDVCRELVAAAKRAELSVTFHRAFDCVRDPFEALDEIVDMGCDRILTSGLASSALEGVGMLRDLNDHAAGRIVILAAAGVSSRNASEIISRSGCHEIHASARGVCQPVATFGRDGVSMGAADSMRLTTDVNEVKAIRRCI